MAAYRHGTGGSVVLQIKHHNIEETGTHSLEYGVKNKIRCERYSSQ